MAQNSSIEWTNTTWNPVTGCTKISAGCDNCYAERFSERFRGVPGHPFEAGFDLMLRPERLSQPLSWKKPRMVFVNSMSDLFHKLVPIEYIAEVFDTMEQADWLVFQVLSKRSSLMKSFINNRYKDRPVLINFMSDFINRFLNDPRPEIAASFDALFGGDWYPEWQSLIGLGLSREAAEIEVYTTRLKKAGNYAFVTSTRILKPGADRSYFHLIYATRHWKGIQEFRRVEKKAVKVQERIRNLKNYHAQIDITGQESLFCDQLADMPTSRFDEEKQLQINRGFEQLLRALEANPEGIKFGQLLGEILQTPLVWENELKTWIGTLKRQGKINIPALKPRERVPRPEYLIMPTNL